VYFTTYYEEWNATPKKVEEDFIVRTDWSHRKNFLEAGKSVSLEVTVTVEKDADYVMISVPIPAGCSYATKPQSYSNAEVHREYDLHETRIYCERMKKGTYTYSIHLTPRYKGSYTLNPSKAEWMYFPILFGRNGVSRTQIR
jgi:alpha-2-macroglobulin